MEIIDDYPPNIDKIEAALGARRKPGTLFCYGDKIYAPGSKGELPAQLVAHEEVHSTRQAQMGVDAWWDKYLSDPAFRYEEELMAHEVECDTFGQMHADRGARRRYARAVALRLSGALYGRMVRFEQALKTMRIAVARN